MRDHFLQCTNLFSSRKFRRQWPKLFGSVRSECFRFEMSSPKMLDSTAFPGVAVGAYNLHKVYIIVLCRAVDTANILNSSRNLAQATYSHARGLNTVKCAIFSMLKCPEIIPSWPIWTLYCPLSIWTIKGLLPLSLAASIFVEWMSTHYPPIQLGFKPAPK